MKRLLCGILILVLLLLNGCYTTSDISDAELLDTARTAVNTEAGRPTARETDPAPAETEAPPAETKVPPAEPSDTLTGVEMTLPEGLTATPGMPWVTVTVAFPRVTLTGPEEERTCSLTVTLDGETVADWPQLLLSSGEEKTVELEFSFDRYQEDRTALICATLTCGGCSLVRETEIAVDNYSEEIYQAMSGDSFPYSIDVIRNQNVVIVYGRDNDDEYTVPVLVSLCSTGRATPKGYFSLGVKREWAPLYGGVWGQYVCGIYGNILFHTVPYYHMTKNSLETEEYNKLGTACSMGCVRLPTVNVKWIYDNCPSGTTVHIYDAEELPVERPTFEPIDPSDPRAGWDPTDPDPANPWNTEP